MSKRGKLSLWVFKLPFEVTAAAGGVPGQLTVHLQAAFSQDVLLSVPQVVGRLLPTPPPLLHHSCAAVRSQNGAEGLGAGTGEGTQRWKVD